MARVDTLIKPRWIVPVEPSGAVLERHVLAVDGGKIAAVAPASEAGSFEAGEVVELPGHALIPGLVNAHTHASMSLLRGLADDLPLMEWLQDHMWPAEAHFVDADFVRDGTRLAVAEMLRGGVTCFNEMYFFPDVAAAVARRAGMRACVGMILIGFPSPWARDTDEYFRKAGEVHDALKNDPLLSTAFAPHAPYTVDDDALRRLRVLADELDVPVHMHVHETAREVSDSEKQHGMRPLARLRELDLLNPALLAVHMTQLSDREVAECAEAGLSVLHCPESNLKLASGYCRVPDLLEAGVNVALGTDGAASNNDLDMFGEMRTAALLAKHHTGDPSALPAATALSMATINGARALGLSGETGSLEPGKWADLAALDLARPETEPVYDVISQLVYAAGRHQVTDVWVAGERVLSQGGLTTLDLPDVLDRARRWGQRIGAEDATA